MKIIVDAMGGDNAPLEILKGCCSAYKEYGYNIILVGDEKKIRELSCTSGINLDGLDIRHTTEVITMNDTPTEIMKSKKSCSMAHGLKILSEGKGDAFISAGNSGALAVGATLITKRIRGIKRCAFAPVIPKSSGFFMLTDSGANIDCRPAMLYQFGLMGSIYMEKVMKIKRPRVGLVNVGTESHKGDELRHDVYKLFSESSLNFVGNIESRDIPKDAADVVVTDGFTGNIILKLYEGMASAIFGKLKGVFTSSLRAKLAASLIIPDLNAMKKQIDYNEYGGAPLMGISRPVFKAHGNACSEAFKNAIRLTGEYVKGNVIETITESISNSSDEESQGE